MAFAAIKVQDIDEGFLQCPICLRQLKEPKILPCLHHYCRDCLSGTVAERDRFITCPTCRETHTLPRGGVVGLKTDFNTKNIIEFIEAAKQQTREGGSFKDAPMCHHHPGKPLQLFCTTCGSQPICVTCITGAHKGHDLQELPSLPKLEREKLKRKTAELMRYKEKIYDGQREVKAAKRKLNRTANVKRDELQEDFDVKEDILRKELRDKDDELQQRKQELEELLKKKISPRKQQLEKEIREAREKYDEFCKDEKQKIDREIEQFQERNEREKIRLQQELESMNKGFKDLLTSLQAQESAHYKKIKELTDHFDDMVRRFEKLTTTASNMFKANNDWTDAQGITNICTKIDKLIEDVNEDSPQLDTLADIRVRSLTPAVSGTGVVTITGREDSVVNIEGVTGGDWGINSISGRDDGCVVVTGKASDYHSHITVINTKGDKVKQDILETTSFHGLQYCAFMSEFKVVSVCWNNGIGIYDVKDGNHMWTDISDIISSWPEYRKVSCVTVDSNRGRVIVGGFNSREVYVFSSDLEYIRIIRLPKEIRYPRSMAIHSGNLLVCDLNGKKAYAVSMKEGSGCKILYEFTKAAIEEGCRPFGVCSDMGGFVYMLWRGRVSGEMKNIIAQYSQDGRQLLQTRLVECGDHAECMTAVGTGQGEKLLIATLKTGKLIRYGLVKNGE